MDYREHFAHLLQHMDREVPVECERRCPVHHYEDGSTGCSYRLQSGYEGPNIENMFVALKEVGYAAGIPTGPNHYIYFPTTRGIAFLERYKRPRWVWFKKNWFAVVVAIVTIVVAVANLVVTSMSRNGV